MHHSSRSYQLIKHLSLIDIDADAEQELKELLHQLSADTSKHSLIALAG